jgi:hypothetical protein
VGMFGVFVVCGDGDRLSRSAFEGRELEYRGLGTPTA